MKTEHEIEQMKIEIEKKMQDVRTEIFKAWDEGNETSYRHHDREYAQLVAKYNILQKRIDDALEKCYTGIRKQGGDYYLELVEGILKGDTK